MKIPFHKACIGDNEIESVVDTLKSGWLTMGPKTVEFEKRFRNFTGARHAVSLNSATAALHLALKAVGIKPGDEVILPTNTFIATAEVVTYFDAVPVLCDIDDKMLNIDVKKINELITDRTKAIIPVHFAGTACDMDEILAIAKKNDLFVIEDAAHAVPATYKGKNIGTLGDITCFSFYATKTLATGEGGMATTDNEQYARKIKINRLHGISRDAWDRYSESGDWYYEVVDNGYKYNLTDICSALGLIQLEKLEWMRDKRAEIAGKYTAAFKDTVIKTPFVPADRESAWHLYVIRVQNRNELIKKLKEKGISTSVHFIPVHKHPYYKEKYKFIDSKYSVANACFEQYLSLPVYPDLTDVQIDYIIDTVIKYAR
ncbi:MAG: DegT/DnrJ/EryC1/StrS family aminotransferase [bacterium]|nr:DegT/DnrJ/EryC1/StrS family aminotransferase [bacterium]